MRHHQAPSIEVQSSLLKKKKASRITAVAQVMWRTTTQALLPEGKKYDYITLVATLLLLVAMLYSISVMQASLAVELVLFLDNKDLFY